MVVCLGWGSLIWEPGGLEALGVNAGSWHADGPRLPVELARDAQLRDPPRRLLSWVISPGVSTSPVLWTPLGANLEVAVRALAEREGIPHREIGRWPGATDPIGDVVGAWAAERGHASVVWTAQPPEWLGHDRAPGIAEAIDFLASLVERGEADHAEHYVRRTPRQIRSAIRAAIEQRFGWT